MAERLVYSTGVGTLCPNCRRAVRDCVCPKGAPGAARPGGVRVGRETKGRAGKGVTTITGLPLGQTVGFQVAVKDSAGVGTVDIARTSSAIMSVIFVFSRRCAPPGLSGLRPWTLRILSICYGGFSG